MASKDRGKTARKHRRKADWRRRAGLTDEAGAEAWYRRQQRRTRRRTRARENTD